jgi:GDPmannose 4,6-dehydratase
LSQEDVYNFVKKIKPTHIFNFAGETNVFNPYSNIQNTWKQNFHIPMNIIESIRKIDTSIRFFQSSSSLMYASGENTIINESTQINPLYPYGISKASVFQLTKELRKKENLFLCTGIFFNHDSERRGDNFFTQKVILGLRDILNKKIDKLVLGSLDIQKDLSYAGDFMDGVKLQMEDAKPEDYIFGSGKLILLRDFVREAFEFFDLNYENYVISKSNIDSNQRPLVSNPSKIKENLGWKTKTNVQELIKIMIKNKIH